MTGTLTSHWTTTALRAIGPLIGVLAIAGMVSAASPCRSVKGKMTLQFVTGPACTGSSGVCWQGTLSGGLKGSLEFTANSLIPTSDTPTTSVVMYVGDSVIETEDGTLIIKHAGALRTTGNGDLAEVDTIIGGTGTLLGTTGSLRVDGTLTQESGGNATYNGTICTN